MVRYRWDYIFIVLSEVLGYRDCHLQQGNRQRNQRLGLSIVVRYYVVVSLLSHSRQGPWKSYPSPFQALPWDRAGDQGPNLEERSTVLGKRPPVQGCHSIHQVHWRNWPTLHCEEIQGSWWQSELASEGNSHLPWSSTQHRVKCSASRPQERKCSLRSAAFISISYVIYL